MASPPRHGRTIVAMVLSTIAVIAVLCVHENGIEKESVPHAASGFAGNPDLKVASEAPEDTFVEVVQTSGPLFHTDGELPKGLQEEAEKIGEEAKGPVVKPSPMVEKKRIAAKGAHKRFLKSQAGKKAESMTAYQANCMTLKAYAMNVEDQIDDMSNAINVLKPILSAVAVKGDCTKQLDAEFAKLNNDKNIQMVDSIAADMTSTIEHEMKDGRGILVWKNLEYHNADCQLDPVECLKLSKTQKTGANFVYIDAERVGWSGTPAIFHRLAVRSSAILDTAHELKATDKLVRNANAKGKKKPVVPFLTAKQKVLLKKWQGDI